MNFIATTVLGAGWKNLSVRDYEELERLPKKQNMEVLVRSSGFTYRFQDCRWVFVSRSRPGADDGSDHW